MMEYIRAKFETQKKSKYQQKLEEEFKYGRKSLRPFRGVAQHMLG